MVTFFVPVAGADGAAEDAADGAVEGTEDAEVVTPSVEEAFVPHAVPTLAAIIAVAIMLVSNLDFKLKFEFIV